MLPLLKKTKFYISISIAIMMVLLIYLFSPLNKPLVYSEADLLELLNNSKRKGGYKKVTSVHFEECQLTWVEEWNRPGERYCRGPNDSLKSARRIDMSRIDSRNGVKVRYNDKFDVVQIFPENFRSLAYGPVPQFKNTKTIIEDAKDAHRLLKSQPNAIATYLQMCVAKPRISYGKTQLIYTHTNKEVTDELANVFKYYAAQCK